MNDWKIIPTVVARNRAISRPESRWRSRPPTWSPPELGRSRPPSRFRSVDFPEPDLPSRATRSPSATSIEIPRSASTGASFVPYTFRTSTARIAVPFPPPPRSDPIAIPSRSHGLFDSCHRNDTLPDCRVARKTVGRARTVGVAPDWWWVACLRIRKHVLIE